MTETKRAMCAYPRLSLAYFMQFAIWGSWAGALGGYAGDVLKMPGLQIGWLYAAIPLGAVISPLFIGPIADRYFAAQKVTAFLHFLGGLCLLACGVLCLTVSAGKLSTDFLFPAMMTLILLSGICFMPTIALINSIVFKHSPSGSAPYVFVFGTIGWIAVNLFIAAFLNGASNPGFFFVGGTISILLALYCLTLPDTPPKGAPAPGEKNDVLGLGALKLLKDPGFAFFVACAFLASIPACNFFFPFQVTYLSQHGYPSPLALTTINQFSELIFMPLLPLFIMVIGLKWVLVIGLAAWSLRYFAFMVPSFEFAIIGLLLHGFCYSFLYVAAYMYADKKAPADMKASVQGLMTFLLLGVGQVLGSQLYGYLRDLPENAPQMTTLVTTADAAEMKIPLPVWEDASMKDSFWRFLDLGKTVTDLMKKEGDMQNAPVSDLGSVLGVSGNKITSADLEKLPDSVKIGDTTFSKKEIEQTLRKISGKSEQEFEITRQQYLASQSHKWGPTSWKPYPKDGILLIPAIWTGFFFVIFLLFGRNPSDSPAVEKQQSEEKEG
ncbi:MAG: MFS transporter [Thermoguttaceae bacterium]